MTFAQSQAFFANGAIKKEAKKMNLIIFGNTNGYGPAPALATFPVQGRGCGLRPFAGGVFVPNTVHRKIH